MFQSSIDSIDGKFKLKFLDQHRRLKAAIHKCQYSAYSHEGLKYEQSEEKARECFLPLLLVRRHASTIMLNARDECNNCLTRAQQQIDGDGLGGLKSTGGDQAKVKCLKVYKDDLKKNVSKVQGMYDGYLQNYSQKDGSLVTLSKTEA